MLKKLVEVDFFVNEKKITLKTIPEINFEEIQAGLDAAKEYFSALEAQFKNQKCDCEQAV